MCSSPYAFLRLLEDGVTGGRRNSHKPQAIPEGSRPWTTRLSRLCESLPRRSRPMEQTRRVRHLLNREEGDTAPLLPELRKTTESKATQRRRENPRPSDGFTKCDMRHYDQEPGGSCTIADGESGRSPSSGGKPETLKTLCICPTRTAEPNGAQKRGDSKGRVMEKLVQNYLEGHYCPILATVNESPSTTVRGT